MAASNDDSGGDGESGRIADGLSSAMNVIPNASD